jgi:uncharacterized membrane protein YeiH
MQMLLLVLDLVGTFVFALSGAMAGVRHRLDLFGVLVLSFAAGNAGGIARDLLIGAVPPAAMSDWRYLAISLLAGIVTFWRPSFINRLRSPVLLFDAAGLSLFAVSGAQTALAFGLNPVMAALLGMLTGIGGGMTRDVLLAEIPTVLRADLYAVAALAGAAVVVIGAALQLPRPRRQLPARCSASRSGSSPFAAAGTFRSPATNSFRVGSRARRLARNLRCSSIKAKSMRAPSALRNETGIRSAYTRYARGRLINPTEQVQISLMTLRFAAVSPCYRG